VVGHSKRGNCAGTLCNGCGNCGITIRVTATPSILSWFEPTTLERMSDDKSFESANGDSTVD
jgi:hypothetical protein